MRVLLAEDDAQNRDILRRLLERLGVTVTAAEDGVEAVGLFGSTGPFDLVLLDLTMPGTDGYAAVAALRQIELQKDWRHTPIVALSGADESPSITQAGFDGFVQKPVGSVALRDVLARWTGGSDG